MSIEKVNRKKRKAGYRVRWWDGSVQRSRTFDRKGDAIDFETLVRVRRQTGDIAVLSAGRETLNEFFANSFVPLYMALIEPSTRATYHQVYRVQVEGSLGKYRLRDLTPEIIAGWQRERLDAGAGATVLRKAFSLVGNVLARAVESRRISSNPQRSVKAARVPKSAAVVALAPLTIEHLRYYLLYEDVNDFPARDAMLVSVMGYAGLRPGEVLGLQWGDVGERSLHVQRAASLGRAKGTKTGHDRFVTLLPPLRQDLAEWRNECNPRSDKELVFPTSEGGIWLQSKYKSWSAKTGPWGRARVAVGHPNARVYDLRHSYASLLLASGKEHVYCAAQMGHSLNMFLKTYAHPIAEFDGERKDPVAEIESARAVAFRKTPLAA